MNSIRDALFPSPCGDVVLKSEMEVFMWNLNDSFRPLAGMWF